MTIRKINVDAKAPVPGKPQPCTLKESATHCTRCNACAQSCPIYLLRPQENFSPRGRTQILRLLSQGKLKKDLPIDLLKEIALSCLLCAGCTNACAGNIPIAHHTLALRKALRARSLPIGLYFLLRMRTLAPKLFDYMVRTGLLCHRFYMGKIFYPLLPKWLRHAQDILPKHTGSLRRLLMKKQTDLHPARPKAVFLPSLYAQYVDPHAGWLSYQTWTAKKPWVLFDLSSGLFEYLYGNRTRCLQAAKKVLLAWEQAGGKHALPLITDSIEIYSFLKNYPLLFAAIPGWRDRAEKLAAQVQLSIEAPFPIKKKKGTQRVALDTSSVLYPAGQAAERARKLLLTTYGKNLLECVYSRFPLPAASIGFASGNEASDSVLKNIQDLAQHQIEKVYCLSGWAALELNAVLRRRYPIAQARFIVYIRTDYERI